MTRLLPHVCKRRPYVFVRFLAFTLMVALAPPLPVISEAATPSSGSSGGTSSQYISIDGFDDGGAFASGSSTASVTVRVRNADGTDVADGTPVTWTVTLAQNNSPAMYPGWENKKTGLAWGTTAPMLLWNSIPELTASDRSDTTGGLATMRLTDIVGERLITVEARVHLDGEDRTASQPVSFGDGPLSVFVAPDATDRTWEGAYRFCNNDNPPAGDDVPSTWDNSDYEQYRGGGGLPTRAEYQAVASVDDTWGYTNPTASAHGAAYAAGWPGYWYWAGEAIGTNDAFGVFLYDGNAVADLVGSVGRVACRRR